VRRLASLVLLAGLLASTLLPLSAATAAARAPAASASAVRRAPPDLPAVDPAYVYEQLAYMATHFQRREAGYDTNLPVTQNGHDEFADYWQAEMLRDLDGFGAVARRDPFTVQGWSGRLAKVPAFNVEVTVPGQTHPEQMVVIGCHYDGEASSTQSANDDGSGCAIELAVAKAMADYWRAHHIYPARTLRFVIFDAEEQGVYGSFHYLNATVNGDSANIVAMFNEEQNGIAYPLRFLGKASNPVLPFYTVLSPLQNNGLYPHQDQLSPARRDALTRFRALMAQAVPAVFAQFQALGYTTLDYQNDASQPVTQPVFTADDASRQVQLQDDEIGSSDQIPFTLAGAPDATFIGNFTYYDRAPTPPPWSYPYDQPQDTIQLMNTYASGQSSAAKALELSLALPGMLTTWMLSQPDVLGSVTSDGKPIAAISDVGPTVAGQPLALDAKASFAPSGSGALSYAWDFGDGTRLSGQAVQHSYATSGTYSLTLTVSGPGGARTVAKSLTVTPQAPVYINPYARFQQSGVPPSNPLVTLPVPRDQPGAAATPTVPGSRTSGGSRVNLGGVLLYTAFALAALIVVAALVLVLSRRRSKRE
jgi:peptidase M28-like protein/PKD domain-containing protein